MKPLPMSSDDSELNDHLHANRCAKYLKALADPDRLLIVQALQAGPRNVSEISSLLGRELVNVSHHLGVLRNAGLVQDEKHGKYVVYSLHPDVFSGAGKKSDYLDLGCCRLQWDKR